MNEEVVKNTVVTLDYSVTDPEGTLKRSYRLSAWRL